MRTDGGWLSQHGLSTLFCGFLVAASAAALLACDPTGQAQAQATRGAAEYVSPVTPGFVLYIAVLAIGCPALMLGVLALSARLGAPRSDTPVEGLSASLGAARLWTKVDMGSEGSLQASIEAANAMGYRISRVESDRFRALSRPGLSSFGDILTVWVTETADYQTTIDVELRPSLPLAAGQPRRLRRVSDFLEKASALLGTR